MKIYTLLRITFSLLLVFSVCSIVTAQSGCGDTVESQGSPFYSDNPGDNPAETITPDDNAESVRLTFSMYSLAAEDTLFVYDGPDTAADVLAFSVGGSGTSNAPGGGVIEASCSNVSGALTIMLRPKTDGSTGMGFTATAECIVLDCSIFSVDGDAKIDGRLDLASANSSRNLFIGRNAGVNNTTAGGSNNGIANTFIGSNAGKSNSIGQQNTFLGDGTGGSNTTASQNTFIGQSAGSANTTGARNTFVGEDAGFFNTTGSDITAIGEGSGANFNNVNNSLMIGSKATAASDHQAVLGNSATQSIRGTVNWTTVSDARYKTNVEEDVPGLAFIQQLRPVSYYLDVPTLGQQLGEDRDVKKGEANPFEQYWKDKSKVRYTGFIAQEVEAAAEELSFEFSGVDQPRSEVDIYGLRYGAFVVPLVKAVQEQQEVIAALEEKVAKLEGLVNSLLSTSNPTTTTLSSASLSQNAPNPFTENTTIQYFIPEGTQSAQLQVTNTKGQIIKQIELSGTGQGQIMLAAHSLTAGNYRYQLIIDGRVVDSKQMVLTK
ncbi:MAG: tail fiber domain-containing protein [Bacteroidota bacterium]